MIGISFKITIVYFVVGIIIVVAVVGVGRFVVGEAILTYFLLLSNLRPIWNCCKNVVPQFPPVSCLRMVIFGRWVIRGW